MSLTEESSLTLVVSLGALGTILVIYLHFYLMPQYLMCTLQSLFDCMFGEDIVYFYSKALKFNDLTGNKYVTLTIDDSPTESTNAILDTLKEYGVHATFFVISSLVEGRHEIMDRIVSEGHEIANHLKYDEASWLLPLETFESQLLEWEETLEPWITKQRQLRANQLNVEKKWFRPGQGVLTSSMTAILKKHG
jgi:peptidoglycan/xylan/chitin deacetylase (PgdA/CDA1 family)